MLLEFKMLKLMVSWEFRQSSMKFLNYLRVLESSGVTRGGLDRAPPGHREKNKNLILTIKTFVFFFLVYRIVVRETVSDTCMIKSRHTDE